LQIDQHRGAQTFAFRGESIVGWRQVMKSSDAQAD
jgi:hypothetical protein